MFSKLMNDKIRIIKPNGMVQPEGRWLQASVQRREVFVGAELSIQEGDKIERATSLGAEQYEVVEATLYEGFADGSIPSYYHLHVTKLTATGDPVVKSPRPNINVEIKGDRNQIQVGTGSTTQSLDASRDATIEQKFDALARELNKITDAHARADACEDLQTARDLVARDRAGIARQLLEKLPRLGQIARLVNSLLDKLPGD